MRVGKEKPPKDCWLENLFVLDLHETLKISNTNESGLYIIQKTNALTFPAEWALMKTSRLRQMSSN